MILALFESPKFLLHQKKFDEAFEVLDKLLTDKKYLIDTATKTKIKDAYTNYEEKGSSYKDLLNNSNIRISIILFILWYIVSYIYYGLIYILPHIFERIATGSSNDSPKTNITKEQYDEIIINVIISCLFEIPTYIITATVPNIPFFGRKNTIFIGFLLTTIPSIFCVYYHSFIPLGSSIIKGAINISFGVLYTYTIEVYPTYMRTTGLGMSNFFSRIGGFTTPLINQYLFKVNSILPFVGFSVTGVFGLFLTWMLPFDTLGRSCY
jgi:putative MFS transporter